MRPIVSCIDSALHKLAVVVEKILTPLQGTISPLHIIKGSDVSKID